MKGNNMIIQVKKLRNSAHRAITKENGEIDGVEFCQESKKPITIYECQSGIHNGNFLDDNHLNKALGKYIYTPEILPTLKKVVILAGGYSENHLNIIRERSNELLKREQPIEVVLLKTNKVDFDVIAMSLYPDANNWQSTTDQCYNNMLDMIARYGKPIMISEVGMDVSKATECKNFLTEIIKKNKSLPNQMGLGVFYWEPQCHNNWQGYTMGAFSNDGKPTIAMDAFLN
jgi:hypothetical protein